MKNPSDATLASLSILKYSKIQNGRQMAANIAKINIIHVCEAKRSLLLLSFLSSSGSSDHASSKTASLNCLKKIKNQDGVQDGWYKQENSIPELHILNVLCLKCSFYVLINKNII